MAGDYSGSSVVTCPHVPPWVMPRCSSLCTSIQSLPRGRSRPCLSRCATNHVSSMLVSHTIALDKTRHGVAGVNCPPWLKGVVKWILQALEWPASCAVAYGWDAHMSRMFCKWAANVHRVPEMVSCWGKRTILGICRGVTHDSQVIARSHLDAVRVSSEARGKFMIEAGEAPTVECWMAPIQPFPSMVARHNNGFRSSSGHFPHATVAPHRE